MVYDFYSLYEAIGQHLLCNVDEVILVKEDFPAEHHF